MKNKSSPNKKAERINSLPCEQRTLAFGISNSSNKPLQSQSKSLMELARELEEPLKEFERLRNLLCSEGLLRILKGGYCLERDCSTCSRQSCYL